MRLLHLIRTVHPSFGGPVEGILRQAFDLPRSHVHEIACLDPADAQWLVDFPLPVHAGGPASGSKRSGGRYGWSWAFVGWLRENCWRYDAIIVNGLWNFTTLGFVLAGRGRGTPYVVFTHGMLDPWFKATYPLKNMLKQLFWLFADGVVVNRASAVLFTSEEERRLARGAFRPYRARERVVAYGSGDAPDGAPAQLAAFRSVVPGLGERRYLLFLSRIHPKKGADLLIGAFARVAADEPGLDLVIAGPDQVGLRDTLHRQADRLGLSGRVHWPGMLQGDAKWGAFRGAEAFVLPSHQENFGIAVAEAMAAGTPVLISNKVNIWREVEAAGAGLVEEDSVEGIHRLLSGFLALAPDERRQMSKAARSAYERHFSADNGARELIAVLEDVIREKAG